MYVITSIRLLYFSSYKQMWARNLRHVYNHIPIHWQLFSVKPSLHCVQHLPSLEQSVQLVITHTGAAAVIIVRAGDGKKWGGQEEEEVEEEGRSRGSK